ncbi:MAG: hypothetical protein PWQ31_767 [Eubacteriales bacterium]|nr:hypothetical protein [Eubacteriales bacterium]
MKPGNLPAAGEDTLPGERCQFLQKGRLLADKKRFSNKPLLCQEGVCFF